MIQSIKKAIYLTEYDTKTRGITYETILYTKEQKTSYNVNSSEYIPVKGDRLWFYPGCNIPRFKVKQFCQKYDVAVVKYKEKSSVRFISQEIIENLFVQSGYQYILKQDFLAWLSTVMTNDYLQLQKDIIDAPGDLIIMDYDIRHNFFENVSVFGKKILSKEKLKYEYVTTITDLNYTVLTDLLTYPNIKSQDTLLSLLNTGAVLDEDMYRQIHKMFKSADKENTKLAMEAMANCDFQKSAVYLLLLVKEYGNNIHDSGVKHHVNFKSLLKYFDLTYITNVSVDDMIDALRHQKLLNVDNLNRLMPLAMETIKDSGDMENIKVKDVELSPEAEQAIAENILDKEDQLPSTTTTDYIICDPL